MSHSGCGCRSTAQPGPVRPLFVEISWNSVVRCVHTIREQKRYMPPIRNFDAGQSKSEANPIMATKKPKPGIRGVHTMFYSSDAAGLRKFLRDKLGFKATDIGDGWMIFDLPEADMGCHPADKANGAPSGL